jgi:hypothetical protein
VRNNITRIFDKIGVENRSQAIVSAREAGLGARPSARGTPVPFPPFWPCPGTPASCALRALATMLAHPQQTRFSQGDLDG